MSKVLGTIAALIFCNHVFAEPSRDFVRANAVKIESRNMDQVAAALSSSKFITVGEMHGTREVPQFILQLYKSLARNGKPIILGLEVPAAEQGVVDKFVRTKDRSLLKRSAFFTRAMQDGRSSRAMVLLLESLPGFARVICFDSPNASSGQQRDKEMAENLISASKALPGTFLILAGNIHSAIEIGSPFDPEYKPMGYFLHSLPGSHIQAHEISALLS